MNALVYENSDSIAFTANHGWRDRNMIHSIRRKCSSKNGNDVVCSSLHQHCNVMLCNMFTKAFKLLVTHKTIYIDESSLNSNARPASILVLSTIYSLFDCNTSWALLLESSEPALAWTSTCLRLYMNLDVIADTSRCLSSAPQTAKHTQTCSIETAHVGSLHLPWNQQHFAANM